MEYKQLRYCLSVCQTLNYSRTAELFFTSRQNIRHAIRGIESELGIKLFDSSSGRLKLTKDGVAFEKRAAETVGSLDELIRDFTRRGEEARRPISIAVDMILTSNYECENALLDLVSEMGCRIDEELSSECFDRVRRCMVDLGFFVSMDKEYPDCVDVLLYEYPAAILVSKNDPLAKKDAVNMEDLSGRIFFVPPSFDFRCRKFAWKYDQVGLSRDNLYRVNQSKYVVGPIKEGRGIGLGDLGESEMLSSLGIKTVPFESEEFIYYGHLVYRPDNLRLEKVEAFAKRFISSGVWRQHALVSGYDRWEQGAR